MKTEQLDVTRVQARSLVCLYEGRDLQRSLEYGRGTESEVDEFELLREVIFESILPVFWQNESLAQVEVISCCNGGEIGEVVKELTQKL